MHELYYIWTWNPVYFCAAILHRFQAMAIVLGSHRIIVVTEKNRRRLRSTFFFLRRKPIDVIPVGSNIDVIPLPSLEKCQLRKKLVSDSEMILGIFGFLQSGRNFQQALYTLKELQKVGYRLTLLAIGNIAGSNRAEFAKLQKLAENLGVLGKIIWTGSVSEAEVSHYLSLVDVYLFPQIEGITTRNTTFMAAFAHGLPIVVFANENIDKRFADGETVILADPIVPGSFTNATRYLLTNPQLRQNLGARAKEVYERNFSWEVIARKVHDITLNANKKRK